MDNMIERLEALDWQDAAESLLKSGYAMIRKVLEPELCSKLIGDYDQPALYRKTVAMERYRFGLGEYKYFQYPLPGLIDSIRQTVYPHLAKVANKWMAVLNINTAYPLVHEDFKAVCHAAGQTKPAVLILKYGTRGYNTLHQDLYGAVYFPIQLVLFLNEPGSDYTGGEFVLTEQTPRAQSKAIVLKPCLGDMLLFATNFRPVKGNKSYYRVNMKHGVSQVHSGERHTLGIIFHDATS